MKSERLNEFIEFMEGEMPQGLIIKEVPEDYTGNAINETLPILEESFMKCSPKDRVMLYLNAKEYQEPKRQRSSINSNDNELPDDIYNQ
jgi:hypothetical protein